MEMINNPRFKFKPLNPKKPPKIKVERTQIIIPIVKTGKVLYQKSFPKVGSDEFDDIIK